jgi:hypothetical protein
MRYSRDDRVIRATRVLGILVVAFGLLYLLPDDTRLVAAFTLSLAIATFARGAPMVHATRNRRACEHAARRS